MAVSRPGPSSIDVIEFHRRGGARNERAKVLVNGTELVKLWRAASQRDADLLYTSVLGQSLE